MSVKDLFKSTTSVVSNKSLSDLTSSFGLESVGVISESLLRQDLLLPNIDFTQPSQFAKYGLAKKYYQDSIKKIYTSYPWDGSKKQKLNWRNNASYLDLYLLDNEYPLSTGSITIGTSFGTASMNNGIYITPSRIEYIKVGTGLASGSVYSASNRESAFSFNSEDGFCLEMWVKQDPWSSDIATASFQMIFDFAANAVDVTPNIDIYTSGQYGFYVYTTGSQIGLLSYGDGSGYGAYLSELEIGKFDHYTFNAMSGGFLEIWKNGQKKFIYDYPQLQWPVRPTTFRFSGSIGAVTQFQNFYADYQVGSNKFSGSLDDVRFWRRSRTDKEIMENWFTTVDGGFDDDELLNPDMGFYYKFNEGITLTSSIDAVVLDYSGRKNHALWIGYQSGARTDTSPIVDEIGDPIIYSSSYRVQDFVSQKTIIGDDYDLNNNSALINNLPGFLQDEDEGEHLQNLTQILGSYFDILWLQIGSLTSMRDTAYFTSGSLAADVLKVAIESNGLPISNILDNFTLAEIISQKNNEFAFEKSIEEIKRTIYKNIYNNLVYIFKSKGTEKAIKSIFRIFGVDDEVLKIKTYSNSQFEIDGNQRYETVRRRNYLDLTAQNDAQNRNACVFNHYTASESGSISNFNEGTLYNDYAGPFTLETTFIIPEFNNQITSSQQVSASLFGFYEMPRPMAETSSATTWKTDGFSFNVFSVKKEKYGTDGKFVFKLSQPELAPFELSNLTVETPWFPEMFQNSKWTMAVRSSRSGTQFDSPQYRYRIIPNVLDILAVQELAGRIIHTYSFKTEFTISSTGSSFLPFFTETMCYVGAQRTNFTGSVLMQTNMKVGSFRFWKNYLKDEDIYNHAYDIDEFGTNRIFESLNGQSEAFNQSEYIFSRLYIPKAEICLMNWDFQKEYTADADGKFLVHSFRGKSMYSQSFGEFGFATWGSNYTGLGYGFNSGTNVTHKDYTISQKNREIGNLIGTNDVQVLDQYDEFFDTRKRPIEYFYTVENSVYSVVSEEILNFFSSIDDFNNLIGEPVNRFRPNYKSLDVLRRIFFSKLSNEKIDIEKYISYYNWLDQSISTILRSLFPASAQVDSQLRTVIESHALERNKYTWQYPLMRSKPNSLISGTIQPLFRKFTLR